MSVGKGFEEQSQASTSTTTLGPWVEVSYICLLKMAIRAATRCIKSGDPMSLSTHHSHPSDVAEHESIMGQSWDKCKIGRDFWFVRWVDYHSFHPEIIEEDICSDLRPFVSGGRQSPVRGEHRSLESDVVKI
jgi:hypothetical protein